MISDTTSLETTVNSNKTEKKAAMAKATYKEATVIPMLTASTDRSTTSPMLTDSGPMSKPTSQEQTTRTQLMSTSRPHPSMPLMPPPPGTEDTPDIEELTLFRN